MTPSTVVVFWSAAFVALPEYCSIVDTVDWFVEKSFNGLQYDEMITTLLHTKSPSLNHARKKNM